MKTHRIYRFGPFRLDADAKVLLKEQRALRLTRKAVETLLVLVENSGEVVTREELMQSVWPDRVVDDANLAQNIAVVRRALKAVDGTPGSIETFAGRGYRILGPITASDDAAWEPPAASSRHFPKPVLPILATAGILGALTLVATWHWSSSSTTTEQPHPVPVTRFAGMEHQAAVSPDGKTVAFVWEREGEPRPGIWVQPMAGGAARAITQAHDTFDSPAWSPDGRHLAFLRFHQSVGAIVAHSLDSGEERVVSGVFPTRYNLPYHHLDWSPDGSIVIDDTPDARHPLAIFLVSPETGEKRRLTDPGDLIIGDIDPHFSRDGKTISFLRAFHRTSQELFTVPAAGGKVIQLTADGKRITGQDWMPDGKALVLASNRSGEFRIWKIGYPPGKTASLRQTGIYSDFPMQLSIARQAPALVYSVMNHDFNIWRLDLAAPAGATDRWFRVVASSGQDVSPQYSPGGDKICFRSDRSGEEQLWVSGSEGANALQITRGTLRPSVGRWSPDARAIVFNSAITREIFVARLDPDGTWSTAPMGAKGIHPVFSPDGRWIYAGTDDSIIRYPSQGGAPAEVARFRGISVDVSADCGHIYFVKDPPGTRLWRVESATGRPEEVLEGLVPYCSSCWALAPGGVYYLAPGEPGSDSQVLRFHDLATGRDTTVLEYPEHLIPLGSGPFSLSPGARYLLCVRVDRSSADLFRVEPFR